MRTFGEVIAEARKKHTSRSGNWQRISGMRRAKVSQAPISTISSITSAIRRVGYLLEQFARELDLDIDLLYFLAKQLPVEIDMNHVSEEQGVAAYRALRRALE